MKAPVILFAFNRLEHLKRTVEALAANIGASESDLIIYSDGPRENKFFDHDKEEIEAVRSYINTIDSFKSVQAIQSSSNKGLARSIIEGVRQTLDHHDSAIILEDDIVTSPYFLNYMNDALNEYKDEEKIVSISGYVYPILEEINEPFFLKASDCWGWATWKRGWAYFRDNGVELLNELEQTSKAKEFDFNGTYPFTQMLRKQINGENDSWAIRWYASTFLADKLTLYPGKSLVENIGNDLSGIHSESTTVYDAVLADVPPNVSNTIVEESYQARISYENYFKYIRKKKFRKLTSKLSSFQKRLRYR